MTLRIMIVDDHEVVRKGIRQSLEDGLPDAVIVAESASVAEARVALTGESIDVAVLDVVLPDGDGIQLCRELLLKHPDAGCVLLTSFPEPRGKLSAAIAGAAAYLPKDSAAMDLVACISAVADGERLLEGEAIRGILHDLASTPAEHEQLSRLTQQEQRVFELVGQGMSNRQIAERMHLTERTVKNYVSRMLSKLDMARRTEAAVLAARLGERRAYQRAREGGGDGQGR